MTIRETGSSQPQTSQELVADIFSDTPKSPGDIVNMINRFVAERIAENIGLERRENLKLQIEINRLNQKLTMVGVAAAGMEEMDAAMQPAFDSLRNQVEELKADKAALLRILNMKAEQ